MRNSTQMLLAAVVLSLIVSITSLAPNRAHSSPNASSLNKGHQEPSPPEEGHTGKIRQGYIFLDSAGWKPVTYTDSNGVAILEGDIVLGTVKQLELTRRLAQGRSQLTDDLERQLRSIISKGPLHGRRWIGGVIPYSIDPNMSNHSRVTTAISHWQQNTSIRFVQRTTQGDFITFRRPPGNNVCESFVGRQGGQQIISLADGCGVGETIHEIAHAVGLWHEQSRSDRNSFVRINYNNIKPAASHNFDFQLDGQDVGNYDCDSIMHYGPYAFSVNNQPTIEPLNPGCNIGQRVGLSAGDRGGVAMMYQTLGTHLQQVPGVANEIAIGANGSVFHIGQGSNGPGGNGVFRFNGTGWDPVPGVAATRIAVAPDGTLWHINTMGDIYKGLQQIQGKAIDIAIGADGSVYHVGTGSMGPGGNAIYRWMGGNAWLPDIDAAAIEIAVEPSGRVWHINRMRDIYRRL